jgi:LysR family glycine cleavage system transcriptional activator
LRIPSTQALRALDSFARHGSVWRAADELHLTRSAVSHQLRLLERDLGFDLLERIGKGVALTPRGQRYASDVRKALTVLGDAVTRHAGTGVGGSFSVSCTPGFASLFLCTHIGEFQQMYPDVGYILTPRRGRRQQCRGRRLHRLRPRQLAEPSGRLLCEIPSRRVQPTLLNKIGRLKPADLRANLLHPATLRTGARGWRCPRSRIGPREASSFPT